MSKIMLINVTHAEESRVGIVEDGQLESFEIESFSREHLKGNIYKGIVRRIHPAIEAAFVDIGADRDAFLPLDEICFRNLSTERNGASGEKGRRRIKDVLKSGDEVLVQIVKEQFTSKPPTLSTFFSLPGRYLVLLPGSEDGGISRKIEGEERARVREMIGRLRPPPGCGIIVRTAAGFDEETGELERDLTYLQRLWESIRKHATTRRAPALIYREHDLVLRNIRDYFTPDISEIFIDNAEVYERAKDFLHNVMPGKEHLLHLYHGEQPIFSRFGLESQIESIYKRRVQLRSGGSIVIDGTEALTAIDVNSGGSMRGASQEETAYRTNLEAAGEVARQLRLRDLGGIIVIDFIDMRQASHIAEVERTLRDAMRPDKARHDIGRISRLGLLEVSRQRLRPAAAASSYTACPMCEGHGAVRTTESAALVVLRKIHHRVSEGDVAQMKVGLPREVAMYLLNQKRDDLAVLEARYSVTIQVVVNDRLMPHQSEIETRTRDAAAPRPVVRPGEVATEPRRHVANGAAAHAPGVVAARERRSAGAATAGESAADGGERLRRRRRRGGRGRRGEAALPGESAAELAAETSDADAAPTPAQAAAPEASDATVAEPFAAADPFAPRAEAAGPEMEAPGGDSDAGRTGSASEVADADAADPIAADGEAWTPWTPTPSAPRSSAAGAGDDEAPETVEPSVCGPAEEPATPDEDEVARVADARAYDAVPPSLRLDDPPLVETHAATPGFPSEDLPRPGPAGEEAPASAPRRRRRRGGRRGGRGRRGVGEDAGASAVSVAPAGGPAGEPLAASGDPEAEGAARSAPRRRRRGGSGRRRGDRNASLASVASPVDPSVDS